MIKYHYHLPTRFRREKLSTFNIDISISFYNNIYYIVIYSVASRDRTYAIPVHTPRLQHLATG